VQFVGNHLHCSWVGFESVSRIQAMMRVLLKPVIWIVLGECKKKPPTGETPNRRRVDGNVVSPYDFGAYGKTVLRIQYDIGIVVLQSKIAKICKIFTLITTGENSLCFYSQRVNVCMTFAKHIC